MTLLFKVEVYKILEAIAQMTDGTLAVYREATEIVRVTGPIDNIIVRIAKVGKAGIEIKNISTIINEEDVTESFSMPEDLLLIRAKEIKDTQSTLQAVKFLRDAGSKNTLQHDLELIKSL